MGQARVTELLHIIGMPSRESDHLMRRRWGSTEEWQI
jgi:hypothetical protein